jgi:hypothetical protein
MIPLTTQTRDPHRILRTHNQHFASHDPTPVGRLRGASRPNAAATSALPSLVRLSQSQSLALRHSVDGNASGHPAQPTETDKPRESRIAIIAARTSAIYFHPIPLGICRWSDCHHPHHHHHLRPSRPSRAASFPLLHDLRLFLAECQFWDRSIVEFRRDSFLT